jgi:hypothetical protein
MGKIIIKFNDAVIDHVELKQGDMKIGRRSGCDIVLDHLAVSGEHANIFTIGGDSFIQDLNSTNGTFINNKRIVKHHLRNGDTVSIGQHSLVYLNEPTRSTHEGDTIAKTVIIDPSPRPTPPAPPQAPISAVSETKTTGGIEGKAELLVMDGKNSGKRIELTKMVTNLGKTGRHAGIITKTLEGFLLDSVIGEEKPKLNGRPIGAGGAKLRNGDIIEVAGTRLQFYVK